MSVAGLQVGIFLAGGLLLMLLGVVIFREDTTRRLNRVTAAMLFFAGFGSMIAAIGASLAGMGAEAVVPVEGEAPLGNLQELAVLWEFFFPTLVYFTLTFPRESNLLKRHPRAVWLLYLPYLLHLILVLVNLNPDLLNSLRPAEPSGLLESFLKVFGFAVQILGMLFSLLYEAHLQLWAVVNVFYVIFAMYLLSRSRAALTSPRLLLQVTIVQIGIGTSLGILILVRAVPILLDLTPPELLTALATMLSLLIGCGTIAWAIIRHQFLDVQVLAKRSLIYSAATGVVVGVYFLLFTWFSNLYQSLAGETGASSPTVAIIFVTVAVLSFQPLLARMESIVDRFFIRDQTDYRNILQQSTRNIIGILDMDSLVRAVYQTIERAFLVERAAVVLLDRATGTFRYVRRGPPPLKHGAWQVKTPEAFEEDEGFVERAGEGVVDTFRLTRRGPGQMVFGMDDPVADALVRASGPVRYTHLLDEIPEVERAGRAPLKELAPYLLVPLKHRNNLVGVVALGPKLADTGFSSEELTLLSVLGSQIAVAVENSWLHEERVEQERLREELAVAREIQQALLPNRFPSGSGFEVSAINLPSREIGGDYYDFIVSPLGETEEPERVLIVVGDVSGKGPPAALLMASLQATLRAVYEVQPSLAATAEKVNSVMCRTTDTEKFVTLFMAEFEVSSRRLTYVNAGHNFPIVTRSSGVQLQLEEGGLLVGVMEGVDYEEGHVKLEPGDVLTIYTDGVTEALNAGNEEFGENRLAAVLAERTYMTAREIRDEIYRAVLSFAGDRPQSDDLTLVVLKSL